MMRHIPTTPTSDSPDSPNVPPKGLRHSHVGVAAFLILGLISLFTIPFFIPVPPAISDSYLYGFSNRAALILFVAFAATFAWWTRGLGLTSLPAENPTQQSRFTAKPFFITLAITAILTILMAIAMRSFGVINEAIYITDRLHQLASGKPPYSAFEFIYGPTMLYLPLGISRLLGIHLFDAYYLSWILSWILGVTMIWFTVRLAAPNTARSNTIYLYLFASFLPGIITYGANYTPLRFIAPPFFAALIWRAIQAGWRPASIALTALAAASWLLFYSPETGLAFLAATFLFLTLFYRSSSLAEAFLMYLPGATALILVGFHIHLFDAMRAMGSGGYNLPLLPSISSILILLLWLAAACILATTIRAKRPFGIVEYLILLGFCGLPGALGRCDPGHMFSNTVAAILAVWIILTSRPYGRKMIWSTYALGSLALPVGLYQSNNFLMMPVKFALLAPGDPQPRLRQFATAALQHTLGPRRTAAELAKWDTKLPKPNPAWNTPPNEPLLAPFGYPSNLRIERNMPPLTNGFFFGLANIMQASQVQLKIEELKNNPQALLLFTEDRTCHTQSIPPSPTDLAAADHETRRQLFLNLQPFYLPKVRHRDSPVGAICEYILANYQPTSYVAPFANATIWQRITK